jgi:hypothetical protein
MITNLPQVDDTRWARCGHRPSPTERDGPPALVRSGPPAAATVRPLQYRSVARGGGPWPVHEPRGPGGAREPAAHRTGADPVPTGNRPLDDHPYAFLGDQAVPGAGVQAGQVVVEHQRPTAQQRG